MRRILVSVATLGLMSSVYAVVETQCPATDICYSLNIPDTTVSSGSGDIYIQISGPTTYSWIGVGQGTQMSGSQIFVIYTDSTGTNITLSPRLGTGHSMPNYNSAAQVELLEGSGVSNGVMTANIKCSSCSSWSGGTMDLSSSTTSWIYAYKTGSSLASDSTSATISQHDNNAYATFEFGSNAQGGTDSNPFLSSSTNSSSNACSSSTETSTEAVQSTTATPTSSGSTASQTATQTTTQTQGNGTNGQNGNNDNGDGDNGEAQHTHKPRADQIRRMIPIVRRGETAEMVVRRQTTSSNCSTTSSSGSTLTNNSSSNQGTRNMLICAHAVMACLAFALFFPVGGIMIRLCHSPSTLWAHAGLQIGAYVMYTAAVGLGIYIALNPNLGELQDKHPIIGLSLFGLLLFQAPAGWMHHLGYKKYGGRTLWSYIHLWIGRVAIPLGIVNAGFGFILSGTTGTGPTAYAAVAAIIWAAYLVSVVIGEQQRRKKLAESTISQMSMRRNTVDQAEDENEQ